MFAFPMAILTLATATAAPDTVLLDFYADWCGPCRQMDSTVKQLADQGYPVRKVNIDQDQALAAQFQVRSIPCFVLTSGGREVTRIVGPTSLDQLKRMFDQAPAPAQAEQEPAADLRAQSPDPPRPALPAALRRDAPQTNPLLDRFMAASVRLKIDDPNGHSYGSGTIVDIRGKEALVLTCGHVFRDSQGKGTISVDLYGPDGTVTVAGRVVDFDLESDVGLVRLRTDAPLTAVPVAPTGQEVRMGDEVVSIGCNNGEPPSLRESQVTGVNKFLGPANLQVAGQPVSGRSGGGLFSADGRVIGVCNAADPTDDEGLYAALASIHALLDKAHLSFVYQPAEPEQVATADDPDALPAMPEAMPPFVGRERLTPAAQRRPQRTTPEPAEEPAGLSAEEQAALAAIREQAPTAEVICIIRSLTDPRAKSEIILLDKASDEFLDQLTQERGAQDARHVTSHNVRERPQPRTPDASRSNPPQPGPKPVVRPERSSTWRPHWRRNRAPSAAPKPAD